MSTNPLVVRNPSTVCPRFRCISAHFLVFVMTQKKSMSYGDLIHPSIPLYKQPFVRYSSVLADTSYVYKLSSKYFMKTDARHMLLKGVNKFLPVHSTILDQIGQNSVQTSILYGRAYMKFYLHLPHSYQMWISFRTGDVNKNLFHKNEPTKCHSSCSDIN
jgi:hypothetical protein